MSKNDRIELFDQVWNTVNEQFYDPNFNGINWKAKYNEYKPLIENCSQTDSLFIFLNKMLYELNSSHCGIGLISTIENNVFPYVFMNGTIGIDIRIIDNEIVIARVVYNSEADLSKLKTGYIIKKIDGLSLVDIKNSTKYKPPFNERNNKFHLTTEVLRHIYGKSGSSVTIEYLDENNISQFTKIVRSKREPHITLTQGMPPLFIESESTFINDSIAYLRFNAFQPENLGHVIESLEKLVVQKG